MGVKKISLIITTALTIFLLISLTSCSKIGIEITTTTFPQLTTDGSITTISAAPTTTCVSDKETDVSLSYEKTQMQEIEKVEKKSKVLNYEVAGFEKKLMNDEVYEYVFWENSRFVEFTNEFKVKGIFKESGILLYDSIDTSQSFQITNTDDTDGFFIVERIFPGKDDYSFKDSENIQRVYVMAGKNENVTFNKGVICYKIDEAAGKVDLMKYFIDQAEKIGDQKDMIVNKADNIVYTCERAHFRVVPPTIEYDVKTQKEQRVVVNEQKSDKLIEFGDC